MYHVLKLRYLFWFSVFCVGRHSTLVSAISDLTFM